MPAPTDIPPVKGELENGEQGERRAADEEKFSALAFKVRNRPVCGSADFLPCVFRAWLSQGIPFTTRSRVVKERLGRILQMHANQREEIKKCAQAISRQLWV